MLVNFCLALEGRTWLDYKSVFIYIYTYFFFVSYILFEEERNTVDNGKAESAWRTTSMGANNW